VIAQIGFVLSLSTKVMDIHRREMRIEGISRWCIVSDSFNSL
jgi:hypothetical protein